MVSLAACFPRKGKTLSDFYDKYYSTLNGATIVRYEGLTTDVFGAEGFPTFSVKLRDGSNAVIEVSRDEEGNGGGFIFGLPLPEGW